MRRAVATLLVALAGFLVCGQFATPGGGGGGGGERIIVRKQSFNTFSSGSCSSLLSSANGVVGCGAASLSRWYVTQPTTITRLELVLLEVPQANTGCTFTWAIGAGDISTTTKPMTGDQAVAGRTLLDAAGEFYSEAVNVSLAAGDFIQLRVDTEATGSAGNDGTCVNGTDVFWSVYGR